MGVTRKQLEAAGAQMEERHLRGRQVKKRPKAEGNQDRGAIKHTTVLPFVLIEMRTTHHQYPSRSCGLAAVCTFAVGYILWVCWIHHVTGVWVYPLLEHLSPGVKVIFFAAVTVIINMFYLVGEVLNNYIWDTQKCIEEGKEKPKLD
ncbi:PREDICTED: androgen-induced gene 1 protein [Nestor notabilis]|uniref:androgen-induced gene 1 protein n=1 Tax=Nestor notabilis TaxID=176057 RepID=UPI0005233114|nr:PREDICTED: androgen-induced gene 1 protein [Nestor notabilis]